MRLMAAMARYALAAIRLYGPRIRVSIDTRRERKWKA